MMSAGAAAGAVMAESGPSQSGQLPSTSMTELAQRDVWLQSGVPAGPVYRVLIVSLLGHGTEYSGVNCPLRTIFNGAYFHAGEHRATGIAMVVDGARTGTFNSSSYTPGSGRFVSLTCHWAEDAKVANRAIQSKALRAHDVGVILFDAQGADSFKLSKAVLAKAQERGMSEQNQIPWVVAPALGAASDAHREYVTGVGGHFFSDCSLEHERIVPVLMNALSLIPEKPPLSIRVEQRLCISVLKGRNLVAKDVTGESDPYVKVYLAKEDGKLISYKGQKPRTPVRYKTLNPEWSFTVYYNLQGAMDEPGVIGIAFEIWDEDLISADDFMGIVLLTWDDLETLARTGEEWLPVTPSKKKAKARVSGDLLIHVHFPYIADAGWHPPLRLIGNGAA